ncbi:MAG: FtsH protease activity modulator HflK [Sulfuricaulis sp.]
MAWNEPGKPGDKDPWGQRRKPGAGGPDLDRIVKNIQQKLAALFGGQGGGHVTDFGLGAVVVVALLIWLISGFYVVNQGERGVVLHFGKTTTITDAGLRWHLPYPIEKVEKVNVEKISTVEIGYRSNSQTASNTDVPKEALMLTEDGNIIDAEFAVQYKINDPANYLFSVSHPETTIAQASESAINEVIGNNPLDFSLTEDQDQIARSVRAQLQQTLDKYKIGVQIVSVEAQKLQPPEEVKSSFDDVVKARQDELALEDDAQAYANDVVPRARGDADRLIEEADGYKASVIARADGDARRFTQVANEYAKAPAVTRERLYIDTMQQVLSNTTKIFVGQKAGSNMIYLPLDKLVPMGEPVPVPVQAAPPVAATPGASAVAPSPPEKSDADIRTRADLRLRPQ